MEMKMKITRVAVLFQDSKGLVRQLALEKEEGFQVLDFVRSLQGGDIKAFPEVLETITLESFKKSE